MRPRDVMRAAFAALLIAAGCGGTGPSIRNVVLVSIDTCRADHVGVYGAGPEATPNIDALARDGVVFKRASTTNPLTLPAHTSLLTGVGPLVHGVRDNNNYRLGTSVPTLAQRLRSAGLATAAFVSAFVLDSQFGLDRGFDVYDDRFRQARGTGRGLYVERRGDETSDQAIAWVEKHRDRPFFLFVHYFDPHQPYAPPEPFASRWASDPYAGEIAWTDSQIGRVLGALKRLGLVDSTLVVVTADHGQGLGAHGEETHGFLLYEPTVHVPLIVRAPGGAHGVAVDEPVSLVDVAPTVLALRGVPVPSGLDGRDLSPLVRGTQEPPPPTRALYFESVVPASFGCGPLRGLRQGRWKYVAAPSPELYDVDADPGETLNVAAGEADTAHALAAELDGVVASARPAATGTVPPDPQTARRLQALGYVSAPAGNGEHAGGDLTTCLDLYTRASDALELFSEGRLDEAEQQALAILDQHPDHPDARWLLGSIALDRGRYADAVDQLTRYLDAIRRPGVTPPPFDVSRAENALGNALQAMDRPAEAAAHYRAALRLMPRFAEASVNLGVIAESRGRTDKAARLYLAALAGAPGSAPAHLGLGRVRLAQGRLDDARHQLERASELAPDDPEVHTQLGEVALAQGRVDDAVASYEHALTRAPDALDPLNALAWLRATAPDARVRDGASAIKLGEHAADLTGRADPWVLDTLAAAYAEAGRFPAAIHTARRAVTLAEQADAGEFVAEVRARLALYEQGVPYREPPSAGSNARQR